MTQRILFVALAGAVGTTARYGLGGLVQHYTGSDWPWGTLAVNALGCFLFGLVWTLADERMVIDKDAEIIMLGGFMGAFTTFSTFIFDTHGFMREAQWLLATGNILVQTLIGLAFLGLGTLAGRLM
ncbi:MAG: CrcB family protein [Anaerolineae bacterium]|nr:CrcB family protein [Anaerolineae bacterium]